MFAVYREKRMKNNKIITVQNIPITISETDLDDYICITDIAGTEPLLNFCQFGKKYIIRISKCSNLNTLKRSPGC